MPRRGENIYKRKDGRWEGRYKKNHMTNGKVQYGSVYAHSYSEVKSKLLKVKNNFINEKFEFEHNSKNLNFYAMCWLDKIHTQVKHSTFVKYSNIVKNHIIPSLGAYKIKDLSTDAIRDFVENKLKSGNLITKSSLSAKSVTDILSVLRLIFQYIQNSGIEFFCRVDLINIKSTQTHMHTINENEHRILVKYLLNGTDNIKLGILICLYTGIRLGEICAMRFEDISLEDNIMLVNKTMQRVQILKEDSSAKTAVVISSPKSNSSIRQIPLPDFLKDIIAAKYKVPTAFILTGEIDSYIEPRTMENKFKNCLKECGLRNYNFHQLRHRFATYCIEAGFDPKTLSEILGHSSVNITLNRYVHSSLELKKFYMNKLQ